MKQLKVEVKNRSLDLSEVVIARKLSILEYDMKRYRLNEQEVLKKYQQMGADKERIINSHQRQLKSLQLVKKYLPQSPIIVGKVVDPKIFKKTEVVVCLGGDNYFQYIASFLSKQLIVGVNADSKESEGSILYFDAPSLGSLISRLYRGDYQVEEWTRLQSTVNERKLTSLAASEIYIGAKNRLDMSRYSIKLGEIQEEHKDSGLIISTGVGSSGWYLAAISCGHNLGKPFSKTEKLARFICTETYHGKLNGKVLLKGSLSFGQKLEITWFAHGQGVVGVDSLPDSRFNYLSRGSKVVIEVTDKPLRVVI